MTETRMATREELFGLKPRTELLDMPEIGPGVQIRVTGYSVGTTLDVARFAIQDGEIDPQNDKLMSVIKAVVEPALNLEDTTALLAIDDSIADKILSAAFRLSGRTVDQFETMKQFFRTNRYALRLWTTCANVFHCMPSDLADKTESEWNTMLAALEVEAEEFDAQHKGTE